MQSVSTISPEGMMTKAQMQKRLVETALSQLGAPYWWGHQVPKYARVHGRCGFDCSNFVAWVYRTALGILFTSKSTDQRQYVGTPVPLDELEIGDLLFVKTRRNPSGGGHVAMYIGNGRAIQAGGGKRRVNIVRIDSSTRVGRNLVHARRVLEN